MLSVSSRGFAVLGCLFAAALLAPPAGADVVTSANARAVEIASRLRPTPPAARAMALVQVSVFEAVRAITGGAPSFIAAVTAPPGASVDAAVAAATRSALLALVPAEKAAIESDYAAELAAVPDGAAKTDGIAVGERAAAAVLAARANDGATAPNTYRPRATPGVYVPTTMPAVPHWGGRKPWVMRSGDQFRPPPPPALDGPVWKRDFAESRAVGGANSKVRTADQTAIARFWEATAPSLYWPLARELAEARGGDVTASARLLAESGVAMDDAFIAVFDGKYAYEFWRPITAIRNAPGAEREPGWEPLIDTPMHPEYPCAHCAISGAIGAVIEGTLAGAPSPKLSTTSSAAPGVTREWASARAFMDEVGSARVWAGVHYRNSADVGTAQGMKVGALVLERFATGGK